VLELRLNYFAVSFVTTSFVDIVINNSLDVRCLNRYALKMLV
jgi:hypothetical protein